MGEKDEKMCKAPPIVQYTATFNNSPRPSKGLAPASIKYWGAKKLVASGRRQVGVPGPTNLDPAK